MGSVVVIDPPIWSKEMGYFIQIFCVLLLAGQITCPHTETTTLYTTASTFASTWVIRKTGSTSGYTSGSTSGSTTAIPEIDRCFDFGCASILEGQGQCVNITEISTTEEWNIFKSMYDVNFNSSSYNHLCGPYLDKPGNKDCCKCMKKKPCRDLGCFKNGGKCVNMKTTDLQQFSYPPMNQIDFPVKIAGNGLCADPEGGTADEVARQAAGDPSCCQCYKRRNMDMCQDTGCGKLWKGQGKCVNMTSL